jgi:hypothetical protein
MIYMEGVDNKILASIKKSGRGIVFFPDRFAHTFSSENEDKENIVKDFVLMPIRIRQLILKAYE